MRRATFAFIIAFVIAIPCAVATLTRAVAFDQKVDKAEAIILGKCVRTRSEWDTSRRWILTYSTFRVEETLKGAPASEVTVVTPGGKVGPIHQDSIGVPDFREGDEQVIFVRNGRVGPTVLYFDQGAYDVDRDTHGEAIVKPVPSDAVRVDMQRGMAIAPEEARSLRDFRQDVRESLRRGEGSRMEMLERERQRKHQASLGPILARYKYLFALAIAGAAIATWQLLRR